ncbi:MAG: glycosyltransferase family 4 protein [Sporichthyaceae bacterium]
MTRTDSPRDVFLVANNIEELGGVQRVTHNLATLFHERGHRVTVVGIQHALEVHDYGDRPYRWLTLNEEKEPALPGASGVKARLDPRVRAAREQHDRARQAAVDRLSALFAEADDGVVVCMQVWSMNWVGPADTDHLHVIGMSHESFDATLGSTRWERVQQWYRDVDLLLLLTEHDAARFELEGFNNVGVMHNSLSYYPDRASDLTAPVVVAAGRLAPEKGYDRLVDAFARVADRHPGWLLRIYGTGPLRPALEKQVERSGLAGRVELPGLADDIEQALLASSVFALSSIHEGLPMALAEGMACGLACVAFDCAPGVREMVTDGVDGLVVPPRNVAALAEGLDRVMGDEALRRSYGAAARASITRFAPDQVLAQWEAVFALVER